MTLHLKLLRDTMDTLKGSIFYVQQGVMGRKEDEIDEVKKEFSSKGFLGIKFDLGSEEVTEKSDLVY